MKQRYLWALVLGTALSMTASAQGNSGKAHGNGHGNPHNAQRDDDRDRDHHGWEVRDGWEYRAYDRGHHPPGWKKGKKAGWKNCNMPPGLAKKCPCNVYVYEGRNYYWYQDEHERIIIRRPVIDAHVRIGF